MTVLYYGIKENNGGLENFAKNLIQAVLNQTNDIKYILLVYNEDFSYRELFEKLGCEVIILPNPRKKPLLHYKKLLKVLKEHKDDVIQLNICSFRNYFLFKACKKTKIKTIIVGHYTRIEGKFGFLHYMNRKKFSKFALNVTNSDDVTKFMFDEKAKTLFVDNGIPCTKFSFNESSRKEIRDIYNIKDDCFLIGQIGRISSEKNQLFSIKVFEKLKSKTDKNIKLILVGKEMYSEPKEYASTLSCRNDILFIGPIYSDIEKFYSAFDVCLLPSIHEGMSLSLLECASNGVNAIFSSAVPKLKIDCPQLRYLDLDIDKWVDEIISIMNLEKHDRKNMLENTIYDMNECAKSYIDLYKNYDNYKK